MENLRTPFFIIAIILIAVAVLIEVGNTAFINTAPALPNCSTLGNSDLQDACLNNKPDLSGAKEGAPGKAIPFMALLDGVTLFTAALMGLGVVVKPSILGRVQGIATLIFSILVILAGITLIFAALALLLLMVGLLLAFPFGTLAYLALYGSFDTGGARTVLSLLMTLKLGFAIFLLIGHQRFLQNTGLVLIVITSLLGNIIITFLHGFPPGFLVSITDAIAAIIVAILAVLWAIFLLIGSIPAIIATLRLSRV
jgi:hypothetical protein